MIRSGSLAATNEVALTETLWGIVETPGVDLLVDRYLAGPPVETFAGSLFDSLGPTSENSFTVADIAAVSLLDVRFGPQALQALLCGDDLRISLGAIESDVDIWDERAPITAVYELYRKLRTLRDVGQTKASKLLARKRPRLAPITDSVVADVLDTDGWKHIYSLGAVLRHDSTLRTRLRQLSGGRVTELRALDIAIWMLGSRSKAATRARRDVLAQGFDLAVEPLVHENRRKAS